MSIQDNERHIPAGGPIFATGGYIGPHKPIDSISISLEFLRGVEAASSTPVAETQLHADERIALYAEAVSLEVARLREEVAK